MKTPMQEMFDYLELNSYFEQIGLHQKATELLVREKAKLQQAFTEGYKRRNSTHYSRDWEEFKKENNL